MFGIKNIGIQLHYKFRVISSLFKQPYLLPKNTGKGNDFAEIPIPLTELQFLEYSGTSG